MSINTSQLRGAAHVKRMDGGKIWIVKSKAEGDLEDPSLDELMKQWRM